MQKGRKGSLAAVAGAIVLVLLAAGIASVAAGGGNNGNNNGGNFGGNNPPPNLCSNNYEEHHVIVVGAGWAGIVSAKLLKDYQDQPGNSNFKFKVLERNPWEWNGRGGYARYLMGGDGNPVAEKLKEYFPTDWEMRRKPFTIVNVFDQNVAKYFNNGQVCMAFRCTSTWIEQDTSKTPILTPRFAYRFCLYSFSGCDGNLSERQHLDRFSRCLPMLD